MAAVAHAWSVLCEKVITDSETKNLSLDVVEQLTFGGLPPMPPGAKGFVVPVRLSLVSLWYRADPDIGGKCKARIRVLSPEGEEVGTMDTPVDLSSAPRARLISRWDFLLVSRSGLYWFVVSSEKPKEGWMEVARVPLQVVFAQGQPLSGQISTTT
jgi:hypothetical protein